MLMVIKASMFSLIKKEVVMTYPMAPIDRAIVHKNIERPQSAPNLKKLQTPKDSTRHHSMTDSFKIEWSHSLLG